MSTTRLNPANFNRFLAKIGQTVSWQRAMRCPCRDPHSGAASSDCPVCRSQGVLWEGVLAGQLGISGQQTQRTWSQFGTYEKGDVVCTLPSDTPLYAMGEFDRVVFGQSTHPFNLSMQPGDKFMGQVAAIDTLLWIVGGAVVRAVVPPTVAADGTLIFAAGAGNTPPEGAQFTIAGRVHPEYFCFQDYPQDRHHQQGDPLPRRVVLRQFDLFKRAL